MKFFRSLVNYALTGATPFAAASEEFQLLMLNAVSEDAKHTKVLVPDLLHVEVSDTVTFTSNEDGQNTASKIDILPDIAKPWTKNLELL